MGFFDCSSFCISLHSFLVSLLAAHNMQFLCCTFPCQNKSAVIIFTPGRPMPSRHLFNSHTPTYTTFIYEILLHTRQLLVAFWVGMARTLAILLFERSAKVRYLEKIVTYHIEYTTYITRVDECVISSYFSSFIDDKQQCC